MNSINVILGTYISKNYAYHCRPFNEIIDGKQLLTLYSIPLHKKKNAKFN